MDPNEQPTTDVPAEPVEPTTGDEATTEPTADTPDATPVDGTASNAAETVEPVASEGEPVQDTPTE